jgi:hypothetical protein
MSDIEYNQDYKGIQGVNYPADGKMFYQQDFMNEQLDIGCEVIDREADYFTPGIIEGFNISVSATAGCIDITAGIARDPLGRRIIASVQAAQPVPDLQTTILAINHIWVFEPYILDGTNEEKMRRTHSTSLGFYSEGNVPTQAVQLFKVQRSGSIVTILADVRVFSKLKDLLGVTPIGTIVAYMPGYFTNGANAGFTAVALSIPGNWKVCDGSLCNDPNSLIFNGAGRYLPNLTDSRFIMGSTVALAGLIGGNANNQVSLSEANLPAHTHTITHTHTFSGSTGGHSVSHTHGVLKHYGNASNPGSVSGGETINTGAYDQTAGASADHTHTYSGTTAGSSAVNSGSVGSGSVFSILPKYLTAAYIIRIK